MPRSARNLTNAGKGRKKGVPNKITREIKVAIENAFVEVGGEKYLVRLAKRHPTVFAGLLGRCIPTRITGGDGGAVKLDVNDVNHRSSEAALLRAGELIARAVSIGSNRLDAPAHTNGSVLPAQVRPATNGHRAPVDAGEDSGGAGCA